MQKSQINVTKVFIVVFLVIFIILGAYIAAWITKIYRSASNYADDESVLTLKCVGYVYDVSEIKYEQGELSFVLYNQQYSEQEIDEMAVSNGKEKVELKNLELKQGSDKQLKAKIEINETFNIYPSGCMQYSKLCTLEGCQ